MKIISLKQGYECDHSTKDYGYISSVRVYYDYGYFDMKFTIPYDTELFELLRKYKNINIEKQFNQIMINLYLYCEDLNEEEKDYVKLTLDIKKAILNKNLEVIKIINAYHGDDDFLNIKTESVLGKRLQSILTR